MIKPKVLFVDDEPNIIHSLKRFTRSRRDDWSLLFASGGAQACELIEAEDIDVLVTDMRMPGVDGADVLDFVSRKSPGTLRVILSGEADASQSCRTVGKSHRFVAKPCDPIRLVELVDYLLMHRSKFQGVNSLEAGSIFDQLSVQSCSFDAINAILQKDDAECQAVAAIVAKDANFAARLLQIVNSAYFGRPVVTCNILRAVEVLGLDCIRDLLSHNRFGQVSNAGDSKKELKGQRCTPYQLAITARGLVEERGGKAGDLDMAYAMGLFYCLGNIENAYIAGDVQLDCLPNRSAVFVSALLGLPNKLSENLLSLFTQKPVQISQQSIANLICEIALQKPEDIPTRKCI